MRNTGTGAVTTALQAAAAWTFSRSDVIRRKVENAGGIAGFVGWQQQKFGRTRIFRSRERLWACLADRMPADRAWHVLEFGVAYGYATDWWLTRLPSNELTWDGFDLFTGLPRAWRDNPAGTFDAGGRTPDIHDPRVMWHVGDVIDTLATLDPGGFADGSRLVLFDLDLYEPTVAAWDFVRPLLQPGDLLYFDEAFDADERRVLDELVLPSAEFEYIGGTSLAVALAAV